MSESYLFSLTLPSCEYLGDSASPIDITLYSYVSLNHLSVFAGLYIGDTSGSTIADFGNGASYSSDEIIQNIILDNNSYFATGVDVPYYISVYNYYQTTLLNFYSSYLLSTMDTETLDELSVTYIE